MIDTIKTDARKHGSIIDWLLLIALLFSASYVFSATIIYDKAHSPYCISTTLTIGDADTLILLQGTTVYVDTAVDIVVHGTMFIRGTIDEPVRILPKVDTLGWGQIKLLKKGSHCKFEHARIVDGAVIAIVVNLVYRHVHFVNRQRLPNNYNITRVNYGSADFQDCSIKGPRRGEGFLLKNMDRAIIRNCAFYDIPDAIEWVRIKNCQITNNLFVDIPDDAIDLNNCTNILIDSNVIFNASDRGLEIGSEIFGPSTQITVSHNLIVNCKEGINFKEGSTGEIRNNTLYQNKYGVVCKEIMEGKGGSSVLIENTIISRSKKMDVDSDSLSDVIINNSISDKGKLAGQNNIQDDPHFRDPENSDFRLKKTSPCIKINGAKSDMGAFSFHPCKTPNFSKEASLQYFNGNYKVGTSRLNYHLPFSQFVIIELFTLHGEKVKTMTNIKQAAGNYCIPLDREQAELPEKGIFLCTLCIGKEVKVFKGVLNN